MHRVTMSGRGQVVIPAGVRKRLGLGPNTRFRLYDFGGKITLVPEVEDAVAAGLGFLAKARDAGSDRA